MQRRDFLKLSSGFPLGLGMLGLTDEIVAATQVGKDAPAKRCLMIFMWGGPSHIDMYDMKPQAPVEIRGEFSPIQTQVPGFELCEHLSNLAKHTDKIALIRSMTHTDNNHSTSAHWMLTGHKHKVSAENFNAQGDDFPHIGAVLSHVAPGSADLPTFVALPDEIGTTAGAVTPGQGGGILGQKYDPFRISQQKGSPMFVIPNLGMPQGMNSQRMSTRMELLHQFAAQSPPVSIENAETIAAHQNRAVHLLTSDKARHAFDLEQEPAQLRSQYGTGVFGQSLLMARRALESGVKLVTVYWHRDGSGTDTSWDTHADNFKGHKDRLIPQVDQPLATLLEDLQQRGLLSDTLVVWNSEFGRTPRINKNAGRDHWGSCNSVWLAGAGVQGGTIFGKSDSHAAKPEEDAVSPADLSATIYSQLGVDPNTTIKDRLDRPFAISEGKVIHGIL